MGGLWVVCKLDLRRSASLLLRIRGSGNECQLNRFAFYNYYQIGGSQGIGEKCMLKTEERRKNGPGRRGVDDKGTMGDESILSHLPFLRCISLVHELLHTTCSTEYLLISIVVCFICLKRKYEER